MSLVQSGCIAKQSGNHQGLVLMGHSSLFEGRPLVLRVLLEWRVSIKHSLLASVGIQCSRWKGKRDARTASSLELNAEVSLMDLLATALIPISTTTTRNAYDALMTHAVLTMCAILVLLAIIKILLPLRAVRSVRLAISAFRKSTPQIPYLALTAISKI